MAEKKVTKTSSKDAIYAAYKETMKKLKEKESTVTTSESTPSGKK